MVSKVFALFVRKTCVCVCQTLFQRVIHSMGSKQFRIAGGQPREHSWLPNEEGYATTDMETDHLHVPAL